MFSTIFPALALSVAAPAQPACNAISGWEQVTQNKKLRFVVLGEMHGTKEMPQIFWDAVCLTSEKRRVVVALELPETGQAALDSFLASDGSLNAKGAFLATDFWTSKFKDGRSSEAMFRLIDDLRVAYQAKKIAAVVAFQPVRTAGPDANQAYEKQMAEIIQKGTPKGAMAVILVGNIHAMKTEFVRPSMRYLPMAGHLPKRETLSFDIQSDGGSGAWACTGPSLCGPITFGRAPVTFERGLKRTSDKSSPYDGQLFLGAATTASPPQPQDK